ncbi:MAG: hypothetical protein KF765_12265 [Parvibaculaceae bacterium]|nr:hypothetical protein [Parvibaculaceae bacterium]
MKPPENLVSLNSTGQTGIAVLSVALDGLAPEWVHLLPLGEVPGRDGRRFRVGSQEDAQAIIAATLERAANADRPIDYDHQTDFAAVPGVGGRAPAAAWMKEYQMREDGIWARVEWTQNGAGAVQRKEYRYLSPVFEHTKDGKVLCILRAGLTNNPNLELAAVAAAQHPNSEDKMDKVLQELLKGLGLTDKSSEADILAALNSQMARAAAFSAVAVAAGCKEDEKPETVATAIKALASNYGKVVAAAGCKDGDKADDVVKAIQTATGNPDPTKYVPASALAELQKQVNDLAATSAGDKATTAVNAAIEAGKLTPALKDWAIALHKADPAKFDEFVGAAPVVLQPGTSGLGAKPPAGEDGLTDAERAICSAMGLSVEDFKKNKQKEH